MNAACPNCGVKHHEFEMCETVASNIGNGFPLTTQPPLTQNITTNVKDGYLDLFNMLNRAFQQAQNGKGHERHANGLPFNEQPIMTIMQRHGPGFGFGQIDKKSDEAHRMIERREYAAADRELQGIIVYAAAVMLRIHELEAQKKEE